MLVKIAALHPIITHTRTLMPLPRAPASSSLSGCGCAAAENQRPEDARLAATRGSALRARSCPRRASIFFMIDRGLRKKLYSLLLWGGCNVMI